MTRRIATYASCGTLLAALLASLTACSQHRLAADSPLITTLYGYDIELDTSWTETVNLHVFAELLRRAGITDDAMHVTRFAERRVLAQLLDEPLRIRGTAAAMIDYEKTAPQGVDALKTRVLAMFTVELADSSGDERIVIGERGYDDAAYLGNSVWHTQDGAFIQLLVGNTTQRAFALALRNELVFAGAGATSDTFECTVTDVRVLPRERQWVFCRYDGSASDSERLSEMTGRVFAGNARLSASVRSVLLDSDHGEPSVEVGQAMYGDRLAREADSIMGGASCAERGSCVGRVAGLSVLWMLGALGAFGALVVLLRAMQRFTHREPIDRGLRELVVRTAAYGLGGALAGAAVIPAALADPVYWVGVPVAVVLVLALASLTHLVAVSLLFSALQIAVWPVAHAYDLHHGYGGLFVLMVSGLTLVLPGLVLALCVGGAVLLDEARRTKLNVSAALLGLGALAIYSGFLMFFG
jgi:hypothetical protein